MSSVSHDWKLDHAADTWFCSRCLAATFDSVAYSPAMCPGKPHIPRIGEVVIVDLCDGCGEMNSHKLECYESKYHEVEVTITKIGEQKDSFVEED